VHHLYPLCFALQFVLVGLAAFTLISAYHLVLADYQGAPADYLIDLAASQAVW
jgi:hypothetical protein